MYTPTNRTSARFAAIDLVSHSPTGRIDLLVGCPPCQGFTSLTSKYKRPDPRNALVLEMARLAEEVRPRIVMIENVPGLVEKGEPLFKELLARLKTSGYTTRFDVLQAADFGVPQRRRRLVLLAGRGSVVHLPKPTHDAEGAGGLPVWRTVRSAIRDMPKPIVLGDTRSRGGPQAFDWHVVREMTAKNLRRIKLAIPGGRWSRIPKHLRPECHQSREAGFSNVYGRMRWDEAAPTITGGCTTFSKGRFGHPSADRTISVREAAMLQTFPSGYTFDSPYMEYVCNIIGNALPCDFATAVAKQCEASLRRSRR